jgi:hypothetical protein
MKYKLIVILMLALLFIGCGNVYLEDKICTVEKIERSDIEPYTYKVLLKSFSIPTGRSCYLYTNTEYNVSDTIKFSN